MRRTRPVEGQDPLIDFIDATLEHIEDIRYELRCMKSDLLVIRKVTKQLVEEHNNAEKTAEER